MYNVHLLHKLHIRRYQILGKNGTGILNCQNEEQNFILYFIRFLTHVLKMKWCMLYTVSPNKHGNSVTIFNLSTSVQLGC